ncbi:hypothetical protein [Haloterrigena alkaliphila]|nr:hypothetical protein [Haloterrigena alkaliphila]UHQ95222.1 hypothetical protein J0X25_19160 [Haloterrigena alkaliphila]
MTEQTLEDASLEIDRPDVLLGGRDRDRPRFDGPPARESERTLNDG